MRNLPLVLVVAAALVVGFLGGRYIGRGSHSASNATDGNVPAGIASPKSAGGTHSGTSKPTLSAAQTAQAVAVDGFQFDGMDFDTSPDFKSPQTSFSQPVKIYFRIKLKDVAASGSMPPKGKITYRRLGKSSDKNGPIRKLGAEDIQPAGKDFEVYAFRSGLTFMATPPEGTTSFEIYIDGKPVGRASFTIGTAAKPAGTT